MDISDLVGSPDVPSAPEPLELSQFGRSLKARHADHADSTNRCQTDAKPCALQATSANIARCSKCWGMYMLVYVEAFP